MMINFIHDQFHDDGRPTVIWSSPRRGTRLHYAHRVSRRALVLIMGIALAAGLLAPAATTSTAAATPAASPWPVSARPASQSPASFAAGDPGPTTGAELTAGKTSTGACPEARPDYDASCGPTFTLPQWSDAAGWASSGTSVTIQAANLDGVGGEELIGRSPVGIWVERFNSATGQWQMVGTETGGVALQLPQSEGFGEAQYADTIQTADLDGDGRSELLLRGSDGLRVYAWNEASATFTLKGTSARFASGPIGWIRPQYYRTIQTADVDGDGRAEVLARSGEGLETWKWDPAQSKLVEIGVKLTALSDAKGWTAASHYLTIQTARLDGDTKADLLARAADGLHTYSWTGAAWTEMGPVLPLTDAAGWGNPQYYETITTGDVDGTGQLQLLARGKTGLQTFRWADGWQADGPTLGALADADGFTDRSRYATIQAANIDGTGGEEVLARTAEGISVWRRTTAGGEWSLVSSASPALRDDPWSEPQHYETIQTLRADGDAAAELIARGPYGVRTFAFHPASGTTPAGFARPHAYGDFPVFTGDRAKAYDALGLLLLGRAGDFRTETYANPTASITEASLDRYRGLLTERCEVAAAVSSAQPPTYVDCQPPRGTEVDPAAWTAVTNQIVAELWAAAGVTAHFSIVDDTLTKLFQDQQGILPALDAELKLPASDPGSKAPTFLKLIKSTFEIGGDVFQFFDTAKKFPRVVRSIALTAHSLGAVGEAIGLAKTPSPPQTWAQITAQVAKNQQLQRDIAQAQRRYVLADYGLSRTVGSLVNGRLWTVDEQGMLSAGRQGFARWAYQLYLPAYWNRYHVDNCRTYTSSYCSVPDVKPLRVLWSGRYPGFTDYEFEAVLPNTSNCKYTFYVVYSTHECFWYSPGDVGTRAWSRPGTDCQYDPTPGATTSWRYGCPVGLDPAAMVDNRDGFAFPDVWCPAQQNTATICRAGRPTSVTAAKVSVTAQGTATMTLKGGLRRSVAERLGPGSVIMERALFEDPEIGAGELIQDAPGEPFEPVALRPVISRQLGVLAYQFSAPRTDPDLPRGIKLNIDRRPQSGDTVPFTLSVSGVRVQTPDTCITGQDTAQLETRIALPMGLGSQRMSQGITAQWTCQEDATGSVTGLQVH